MRVDVEEIDGMNARRSQINTADLSDIEWYEDGVKLTPDPSVVERFRFTGLCNTDFASCRFWEGPTDVEVVDKTGR